MPVRNQSTKAASRALDEAAAALHCPEGQPPLRFMAARTIAAFLRAYRPSGTEAGSITAEQAARLAGEVEASWQ